MRNGKQDIYVKTVGGAERLLFSSSDMKHVEDWSADGRLLIFRVLLGRNPIYGLPLSQPSIPNLLFESPFLKDKVHLSPDGKWVAFQSDDPGIAQAYIASFPAFTDRRQVSADGGVQPRWRNDGRELLYLSPDRKLMSVDIQPGPPFQAGTPKVLFQTRITRDPSFDSADLYNPSSDGKKFLLQEPLDSLTNAPTTPITVVLNWTSLLKKH
jgi:Tol biopolymer transport system component